MNVRKVTRPVLVRAIERGMTRLECATALGVSYGTIQRNIRAFGLTWPRERSGVKRTMVDVEIHASARETAVANWGRASASVIADAIGTTRCAVIGHWFRARASGIIPNRPLE
jgi:hypothetical protein